MALVENDMPSFIMKITREDDQSSTDHEVIVEYEQSAYGITAWMSDEDAKLFGQLSENEMEKARDIIANGDT